MYVLAFDQSIHGGALKLGVTGLFKLGLGLSVAEVRNEWFFRDENFIYLLPSGVPILFRVVLLESLKIA